MRNFTLYPMSSYQGKLAGLAIIALALIMLLVVKFFGPLSFIPKLDRDRQLILFFVFTVLGMYQVVFSKEKNEDERVQRIRAKCFQSAFMIFAGTLIAILLTSVTSHEAMTFSAVQLCTFVAFGLSLYLLLFHIGLYFDPAWNYNDDTVLVNIRKNKTFFIIYFIAIATILATVFLMHKS